jgi:hypothetical protein
MKRRRNDDKPVVDIEAENEMLRRIEVAERNAKAKASYEAVLRLRAA